MNITIDALWFYGYMVNDIGKNVYDNTARSSKFHWRGQVHESPWMACNALSSELYKIKGSRVFAAHLMNEEVVGVKITMDIGFFHQMPDAQTLAQAKKEILEVLGKVGFVDLPEPKLYFGVETN